ncbi:hypothetical protein [Chondromyces crocatus]|uniref:Dumpy n=1 Tax=Chondromyces crocatus TaxID=52 RepID=A0A0K1EMD3_CHOCO|nr:hypothetical protein [Chondromyces crocatus]AKT41976.1 uncharacterized protein CMC5_061980 [Chondromyces crocatus]
MRQRSPRPSNTALSLLTSLGLAVLAAVTAGGCSGCDEPSITCDATGQNCVYCDAYGCSPVDPGHSSSSGGLGGSGGNTGGSGGEGGGVGGGVPACDPETAICPCDDAGACPGDLLCSDGLCVEGCDFSYECAVGSVCADGQCVQGCVTPADCASGATCENGVCVPDPQNPACSNQNPCPDPNDVCVEGQCATGCSQNSDCPDGEVCNASTGACILDPSPTQGCSMPGSECGGLGQVCMGDGYCHYPCTTTLQCKQIDSRFFSCDQGICKTEEQANPECTSQIPCPSGKSCINNRCL